jgi:5'-3' exonuclease
MKILIIDGMNFLHRARSGFMAGENPVVFNSFRNLRALVGIHTPDRVYFVLEGHPKQRIDMLPTYKANRIIETVGDGETPNPELEKKLVDRESFYRQVNLITDLLCKHFPITVIKHQNYECDDVIYNLIKRDKQHEYVVASNDSDFIQLLDEFDNVKVYNPMLKSYMQKPDFDYVIWKSLRGDGSDNIKGLPGIGDKTAAKIMDDPDKLMTLFENSEFKEKFNQNYSLIKFIDFLDEDDFNKMEKSSPIKNWDAVNEHFQKWDFQSILKEKSWEKFIQTFDSLI